MRGCVHFTAAALRGRLPKWAGFILASDFSLSLFAAFAKGGAGRRFAMTIASHQASRVRCRLIAEDDLEGLADLLSRGFPHTHRAYWTRGFARWQRLPAIAEMPRYGYLLDTGFGPVGAILMIASRRGEHIIANLCGFHVDPQWQSHSTLLLSLATKLKQVTYVNAAPAPHTWRMLQAQGFSPYNFGRTVAFALPGRGLIREQIPDTLPEAQLLRDHRA